MKVRLRLIRVTLALSTNRSDNLRPGAFQDIITNEPGLETGAPVARFIVPMRGKKAVEAFHEPAEY